MSHHRMFRKKEKGIVPMPKYVITLMLLCASLSTQVTRCNAAALHDEPQNSQESAANSVNPVVQWNRTLLVIVRTPGAQPATVHPTRSFAILHAAVYDAVNAIDATHKPYLVRVEHVSARASQEAAVDAAAHETLITLYPAFQTTLDQQYDRSRS